MAGLVDEINILFIIEHTVLILDCQQFAADLIECFAYNLFLKNAHMFKDLSDDSA